MTCHDFVCCLYDNGELFLWGPTPLGQFNCPYKIQDMIHKDLNVKDVDVGDGFSILIDN